jgi:hypothetical protein
MGSMADSLQDDVEEQYAYLQACRTKPHVLDNATIGRVIGVYSALADDLWVYEEQFSRWKDLSLTSLQRRDVDRRAGQLPAIRERITAILTLAEELKGGTIETALAKSDLELGLEVFLALSENSEKRAIGGDLSVLPFLEVSAIRLQTLDERFEAACG